METVRDGFSLHRWLSEQGIVNLLVGRYSNLDFRIPTEERVMTLTDPIIRISNNKQKR